MVLCRKWSARLYYCDMGDSLEKHHELCEDRDMDSPQSMAHSHSQVWVIEGGLCKRNQMLCSGSLLTVLTGPYVELEMDLMWLHARKASFPTTLSCVLFSFLLTTSQNFMAKAATGDKLLALLQRPLKESHRCQDYKVIVPHIHHCCLCFPTRTAASVYLRKLQSCLPFSK